MRTPAILDASTKPAGGARPSAAKRNSANHMWAIVAPQRASAQFSAANLLLASVAGTFLKPVRIEIEEQMKTIIAEASLYAMLDGAGLFDRASMHLLMVRDGYDVLGLCRGREVPLVLLTQTLGNVSGLSVVRALRHLPEVPRIMMVLKD